MLMFLKRVEAGLPFPKISKEDDAFLDKWYEKIKKIKKPKDQLNAAIKFIDEYPELVPAWGFEGEYLLDINAYFIKNGHVDEIHNFLTGFRNRFPGVYQRKFGYYDADLIYYALINDKKTDIPLLLDNFEKYPEAFPDKLFEIVHVLALKGEIDLLIPFLKKVHKSIIVSDEIMGGDDILSPLMWHIESKYLQINIADNKYIDLCNEIKDTVEIEIYDKFLLPDYWKKEHETLFSKPGIFSCNINKKKEIYDAYRNFVKQFTGYLYENSVHNWVSACLIGNEVMDYLSFTLEEKKVNKQHYFAFENKILDSYIAQRLKDFLWVDAFRTNALLTGAWYFAEFLFKTENANEKDMLQIKKAASELHTLEQKINKGNLESSVFSQFPMSVNCCPKV